ncbi:A disintegrin and metalloproteinase with thrombospondin motifs 2-like isoform X1 [Sitophilus oryzae]|uniref:A disintegrin and metalloproteinase with thrombospondin motifs 2-like isoform X1 n=1 Tax=Sitophilus oryzae TaxID=7048 RepID=A0A6J2XVH7_SITOR|nr:A disintegrin and metalloproteinase with thrombospondin motifs 2-like isoform X1 [Sitophilus oryzae]
MKYALFLFSYFYVILLVNFFQFVELSTPIFHDKTFGDVNDAEIVYPEVSRSTIFGEEITLIQISKWLLTFGEEENLHLSTDLEIQWIHENDSTSSSKENLPQCEYKTGTVQTLETTSRAAVSICQQDIPLLTGYFQIKENFYFFQPDYERKGRHYLFKRKEIQPSHTRSTRSVPPSNPDWLFNLTGDTFDIPGDDPDTDFELRRYQHHQDGPLPASDVTSLNKTLPENDESEIPLEYLRKGPSAEGVDRRYDEENGYFYDSAWSALSVHTHRWDGNNLPTRWLEIAVAVDHTLIQFHGKDKVQQYVLSLMNIVSAIYQDPSLGANLKLVISRLLLYEHNKHGVVRTGHAKKSLENVNIWNRKLHASLKPDQPRHDIAVWLTRSDIGGPSGYAPVGGVCDPKRSCSLNRDEGLTSAFIIAHEMAHILGLTHDGDKKAGNTCDEDALEGSVMAPMVAATFSKFSWSGCSKKEFQEKVSNWDCLTNPPSSTQGEILLNATLQTIFSMDEQCRMEFGDGYSMCRAFDVSEPCSHLWCGHKHNPFVCKTKKGPPLEGTECGFGKWCFNGYCSEITDTISKIPIVLNPQHGGWSIWGPWGPCSRSCGTGIQYRSRKCDNPKPSYGGKTCEGRTEDWQICSKGPCKNSYVDLRAEQCKMLPKIFPNPELQVTDTWLPYESDQDEQKCKFSCISDERKEIFMTNENLPDGTPCSYENQDNLCVQGVCYQVGCDGKLNSTISRDSCGVCGGDESECYKSNSTVHKVLKREITKISVLPKMARQIRLETVVNEYSSAKSSLAFVLKNRRKKGYIVAVPNTSIHSKIVDGVNFFYNRIGRLYKLWGFGPILAETIIMLISSEKNISNKINITYNTQYSIQKDFLLPSKRFVWIMGGWGPCSASCGGGRRQKTVACWDNQQDKLVKRKYCSLIQKPVTEVESCNKFGCDFKWVPGDWEPCSQTCGSNGLQYREIYCVPESLFGTVSNISAILANPWKYMVNPTKCAKNKPADVRECNRKPCFYYWEFGNWSQCSESCGTGITSRTAHCPADENGTCGEPPPPQRQICLGDYTRHNNKLCKGRRLKRCKEDTSKYCAFELLQRYCELRGFRSLCCKSCSDYIKRDRITNVNNFHDDIQVLTYQNMI